MKRDRFIKMSLLSPHQSPNYHLILEEVPKYIFTFKFNWISILYDNRKESNPTWNLIVSVLERILEAVWKLLFTGPWLRTATRATKISIIFCGLFFVFFLMTPRRTLRFHFLCSLRNQYCHLTFDSDFQWH